MQQYPPQSPSGQLQGQYQQPQWQGQKGYPLPPVQPQPAVQVNVQTDARKKRAPIGWIVALVIMFVIGYAVGSGSHSGTATTDTTTTPVAGTTATHAAITPTAAHVPTWATVQTFSGNGAKKTETFTTGNDWKILWTCDPASFGTTYNVIVGVTNSDNTPVDPAAINTLCKSGNTSGSTEERQGGSVFLDIESEGAWTITVQEPK